MVNIYNYKHCPKCDNVYSKIAFHKNRARYDGLDSYCYECHKASRLEKYGTKVIRESIIKLLGGKCVGIKKDGSVCGYDDDIRALQIDHIDGGGRIHYMSFNNPFKYLEAVKNELYKYQCLCANCNTIKKHTNEEYRKRKSPECLPIIGEIREAVLKAKAPEQGRFVKNV